MAGEFVTFQLLHSRQVAEEMGSLLDREGIPYQIVESRKYFDPSFAYNKVDPEINLNLRSEDFTSARNVLEDYYSRQLGDVDLNYYLFRFSDEELLEIIRKPDEWGIFDHALAKKILAERGISIPGDAEREALSKRLTDLRKPDRVEPLWIGLGYIAALAGGFFGILMGWLFSNMKKTLPNGERVFLYREEDRKHGQRILKIGLVIFLFFMVKVMLSSFS